MTEPEPWGPFAAVAESTHELVYVWKPSGEMLWVNRAFERETGMTLQDFGFRNPENPFVHPEDLPPMLAEIAAFVESDARSSPTIVNRFFDMWGRTRQIQSIIHKVEWAGQPALLTVSQMIDRPDGPGGSEAGFRQLVEAADDGIVQLDPRDCVVTSNRRMHDLTGLRHIELVRRPLADLFVPPERERALAALARLHAGEAVASFQARLESGPWLDVKLARLDAGDPSVVALAIARDVTETRRLEAEVLRREKEESIGLLVGGIAHDLNNILTGVIANASDAANQLERGSPLASVLADVQLAGERAAELGRAMLAYLGQAPTTVARVELDNLVRETMRVVGPLLGATMTVNLDAVTSHAVVLGDASQLGQVVMNLVTNAAQALGSSGGHIRVATELRTLPDDGLELRPVVPPAGRYARVLVTDDGPGMPPEVLARIFDPYFTTKTRGRGLGLATALGVLRRHGGAIRVASEPGRGTTFEVFLPVAEHLPIVAERPSAGDSASAPRRGATILFVDDEETIQRIAKRVLERAGHRTLIAARGDEALALLQSERVDAVVLDSTLPDAAGVTVAARMRELVPGIPILRSSGFQAEGLVPPGEPFLPKPYRINELLTAVESLLASVRDP